MTFEILVNGYRLSTSLFKKGEWMLCYTRLKKSRKLVTETRLKDLERQVGLTSANSSNPPSSDGLRKPKSMRKSCGKKGAPKNHDGYTLKMIDQPDEIEWHRVQSCTHCATSLENVPSGEYIRRQVFDLPVPRIIVTEHRIEKKCWPNCATKQRATFQEYVKAPVQYGGSWAAWCAYLHTYQLLPLDRISQLFHDMTGYRASYFTTDSSFDTHYVEPISCASVRVSLIMTNTNGQQICKIFYRKPGWRPKMRERQKSL